MSSILLPAGGRQTTVGLASIAETVKAADIRYLQPFVDVNKRTSRLACNIPLIRHNLVTLSFLDVPEQLYTAGLIGIYELNRIELLRDVDVWAYERSVQQYKTVRDSLPEPDPFRLRYRAALPMIARSSRRPGG